MNVAVCVKFTPDVAQIRTTPDDAPLRINPLDENGLEAAVRLGGRVTVVTVAPQAPPRELVLRALAMGADEALLVLDPAPDALAVATALAPHLGGFDLVLCGEASVDAFNAQVGPRVAEALGCPSVTAALALRPDRGALEVDQALEDVIHTVRVELPAVVTVCMEANVPRMPTVLQIMGAGRKPVREVRSDTRGDVEVREVVAPPTSRRRREVGVEELLPLLGAEGLL